MSETIGPHIVTQPWVEDVLNFWFKEAGPDAWWTHKPELDAICVKRFNGLWTEQRSASADDFLTRANVALAAILLFDQLPRNMFRGTAQAFVTDPLARDIARGAISHGYDIQIGGAGRAFFYLPFEHSEERDDQALSLQLFTALGDPQIMTFAQKHHDIIARFGRFPHRNAALGRETRPEEEDAIAEGSGW